MPGTSARLLSLLSLLQVRRDWPGPLLAERLGVSPRTARRDVDRLRELGYPVQTTTGPDGGYRLAAGTQLPPLLFDDEQAVALAVALQVVATTGTAIGEAAVRALSTVRQVMPARLRHRVDTVQVTAAERATARPQPRVAVDVLVALSAAVHAREVLRFDHTAEPLPPGGERPAAPPRRVQPHHLVTRRGSWKNSGRAAAASSRSRGRGPAWPPRSGGSTPTSRWSAPPSSGTPSPTCPAATPTPPVPRAGSESDAIGRAMSRTRARLRPRGGRGQDGSHQHRGEPRWPSTCCSSTTAARRRR
jgi:biotin operon repressor